MKVKVAQSCPTLCNLTDCTVHGILQARTLEWVSFPSAGDLPNPGIKPRSPALQADSLPTEPPGKPVLHCEEQRIRWTLETDFLSPRSMPWFLLVSQKKTVPVTGPTAALPYRAEARGNSNMAQRGFSDCPMVLGSAFCLRSRSDRSCFSLKSERWRKKGAEPVSTQISSHQQVAL